MGAMCRRCGGDDNQTAISMQIIEVICTVLTKVYITFGMKKVLLIGALCVTAVGYMDALAVDQSGSSDSLTVNQQKTTFAQEVSTSKAIFCSLKEDGYLSQEDGRLYKKKVSSRSLLPISRIVASRFGFPEYEVMYCGRPYRIDPSAINSISDADKAVLNSMSEDERPVFVENARTCSVDLRVLAFFNGIKVMQELKKKELIISRREIYDTSEYTEGTGFDVEVLNMSNKTIKYISFTVIGYNSVGDPVRGRLGRSPYITVKGVGPIKANEPAVYDWEYLWFTDLVQTHKITQISVQYMDGTTKIYSQINRLYLSDSEKYYYDILSDPDTKEIVDEYMAKNK